MQKVRVAMVGCGGFQRSRTGNLAKVREAEIVALVDPSPVQIDLFREAHPQTRTLPGFEDHRRMLDAIKPDAIMIATPHTQHVTQILDGFAAGAHVLCEKPVVTTLPDAHRIIAARDEANKVGMVSYQRHFRPEFRYIREKIRSGEAGKVEFIAALQSQSWLTSNHGTWRQDKSLSGGGQLTDSGSHLVDIVLWTAGLSAESVSAYGESFGMEVDINSAISIKFKNGAIGTFSVVGNGKSWHEDISFYCEHLIFHIREGKLSINDRNENLLKAEHLGGGGTPDKNFIDACRGVAECESPFECGLEVIRLTEAAWKSMDNDGARYRVTD